MFRVTDTTNLDVTALKGLGTEVCDYQLLYKYDWKFIEKYDEYIRMYMYLYDIDTVMCLIML